MSLKALKTLNAMTLIQLSLNVPKECSVGQLCHSQEIASTEEKSVTSKWRGK